MFDQAHEEDTSIATILVRASTENFMNDVERALDDGINTVKAICNDGRLLPGAGAVELELSKRLKQFADEDKTLDQYGIRKFAEAFDVVPRTLVENSGNDPTSLMHQLHTSHDAEGSSNIGFNVDESKPFDALEAQVFDLYATKTNALYLAMDAALTILRVDQIVMSKPAGGPKPRSGPNPDF